MGKYKNMNFDFDKNREYEDIVSDSSRAEQKEISLSEIRDRHYKRKSHGIKGWWQGLSRGRKAVSIILSVVIFFGALVAINPFHMIEHMIYNYNDMTENKEKLGFETQIDKEVVNIALFGIDTRNKNTFKGNSDSIMILSLNTKLKEVKIVSIMRDTIVPITTGGKTKYAKINSAYAQNPETAVKTLNEIFGLDITEYATVNFFGMSEIIDAVGGIDATVTEDELKWKGKDHPNLNNCMDEICENLGLDAKKYYINSAGEHHMNGVQAVAYSRVRNCKSIWGTNNDYGRTDRQRHVMEQLFNKAIKLEQSKYTKLAKALIPCTETSLSYKQILSLAFNILLNKPTFYQARIPQDDWQMPFRWSGYGSVVYYDLDYAARVLNAVFYEDMTFEDYIAANGVDKNDWFARLGKKTKTDASSGSSSVKDDTSSSDNTSSVISENVTSDNNSGVISSEDNSSVASSDVSTPDTSKSDTSSENTSSQAPENNTSDGGDTP